MNSTRLGILATCILFLAAFSAQSQILQVTPARALADEPVNVTAAGLQPGEHVTLKADLTDGMGTAWKSESEFIADAQGNIDLSKQAPAAGSYKAVSSMGPIWSMTPASPHDVDRYHPPKELASQIVNFMLLRSNQSVARGQLEQDSLAEGVRQIKVTGKLEGVLFLPPGDGPSPGILVVGGSEGGIPLYHAALLASHGYAAFALAYFRSGDLPQRLEGIPMEYFGHALSWMMAKPGVAPGKVAAVGVSRGGELALQLGSLFPQIKAVVAYVPANVRYPACCGDTRFPYAWTLKGEPLAYTGPREHGGDELRALINVENTQGPVLLVSGGKDRVWPSSFMANSVAERLKHHHFAYQVELLNYPEAGHIAGRDRIEPEWHGLMRHPVSGNPVDYGGSVEGNALSSLDAIPKVLAFLNQNLKGGSH